MSHTQVSGRASLTLHVHISHAEWKLDFLGLAMISTHMTAVSVSGADDLRSSWSMLSQG